MSQPSRRAVLRGAAALSVIPGVLAACDDGAPDDPHTDLPPDTGATDPPDPTDTGGPVNDTDPPPLVEVEFDPINVREDDAAFPHAVQAGAMERTRAVLLTRARWVSQVRLRVWLPGSSPTTVLLVVDELLTVPESGVLRVAVEGLVPGERHHYAFFTLDAAGRIKQRSGLGSFRTAPEHAATPPLTLGLAACNGLQNTRREDAFGRFADHDVDAIVHLGDIAYLDSAETLQEYRDGWGGYMATDGYKAALASAGWYAVWDDHEIHNNWTGETVDAQRRAAAFQAFVENVAVEPGQGGRLWRSYRWGATAELFVLDCRSERKPSTRGPGGDHIYLSRDQLDWLKQGLKASPCRFKLVVNPVPITDMPAVFDVAIDDRWEGYPKQRRELLDWIASHDLADVYFLSGDFHICFVGRVERSGPQRLQDTYEIAVTSGNVNPAGLLLQAPQFPYAKDRARTVLATFDPASGKVTVRFHNPVDGTLERELVLG